MNLIQEHDRYFKILNESPKNGIKKIINDSGFDWLSIFIKKHRVIVFDTSDKCLYLESGCICFIDENGEIFREVDAPYIVGLPACFGFTQSVKIRANCDSSVRVFKTVDFIDCINANSLWKEVANVLAYSYAVDLYVSHELQRSSVTTLEKVAKAIYMAEHYEKISDKRVLLARFIVLNTLLSRSAVMKAIRYLRNEGAIVVINGRLVKIHKEKLIHVLK